MSKKIGGKVLAGILAVTALAGGATYVSVENGKKQYDAGYEKGYDNGHDKGYNEGLKIEVGYSEEEVQKKIEEALNAQKVGKMIDFSKIGATSMKVSEFCSNGNIFFMFSDIEGIWLYDGNSLTKKWEESLFTTNGVVYHGSTLNGKVVYFRNSSKLVFFDVETGTPCVISESEHAFSAYEFGNGEFISVGGETLYYDLSTKQAKLISSDYKITSLNLVEGGAFYYTSTNDLYFVDAETNKVSFIEHDSLERGGMGFIAGPSGVYVCVGNSLYTYDFMTKERNLISTTFTNAKVFGWNNDAICVVDNGLSCYRWESGEFIRISETITSIPFRIGENYAFYSTETISCLINLQTLEITELSNANGYATATSNTWNVQSGFVFKTSDSIVALNAETKEETVLCSATGITVMKAQDGLFLVGSNTSSLPGLHFMNGATFEVSQLGNMLNINKCIDLGNGYLLTSSSVSATTGTYFVDAETKNVEMIRSRCGWTVKADFESGALLYVSTSTSSYSDGILFYNKETKKFQRYGIDGTFEDFLFSEESDGVHIVSARENAEYVFDIETKEMRLLKQYTYIF